ncbi:hypothetical protein EP073_10525 [Geovibrio thiophilus]|uniref:Alpha/beta hydrolase n=1 Tax=Geovibrio thiophilus TaxID=139438 RepID=A0A410K0H5_9BACT|nr:hypothetical protein [Geovibrio thiophilus]QAR33825.1 hypothetical protein EP073_10525 [Geovibrio thiophilus]
MFSGNFSSAAFLRLFLFAVFVLFTASGCGEMKKLYSGNIPIAGERFVFKADNIEVSIPYEGDIKAENAEALLIMIHDDSLNPVSFMSKGLYAADVAGGGKTAVIAPQFLERRVAGREKGMLFWDRRWRGGGYSLSSGLNKGYPSVSSFAVLERIINDVYRRNKGSLKKVIIAGHGGGAQFVIQFAAMNSTESRLAPRGVEFTYVAANPSSYLYLNKERFRDENGRITPLSQSQITGCFSYNSYKYGLDSIYGYGSSMQSPDIKNNLLHRHMVFVVGRQNVGRSLSLDNSCGAELQGKNRIERALLYKHHLEKINGGACLSHTWLILDRTGHNPDAVFSNHDVIHAMFADN